MKIVSGGQTGVDRAALDVAIELGFVHGGWCPKGRRAEDGFVPKHYNLQETSTRDYMERAELNVREAHATLILTRGRPTGGTARTVKLVEQLRKPYRVVDLGPVLSVGDANSVHYWIERNGLSVLNVAGPRESKAPGIYDQAVAFLRVVFGA